MSFVSFERSRDLIREAHDQSIADADKELVYFTAMVTQADKDMVKSLAKRYSVSQGFVMRAIFEQWRESQLKNGNGKERE